MLDIIIVIAKYEHAYILFSMIAPQNRINISMSQTNKKRIPPLWVLSLAGSLSPFGMTIVVPTLGGISQRFDASISEVQFVISAYLFGLALAQPICGFLCDRYGRRPVMLIGFGLFTIASIVCAFVTSLDHLILGRFLQAVSVSVGTVASRAILRDSYEPNRMAEAMSYIAATMGLAPILAPFIGGTLDSYIGYTSIFLATAVMGLVVFVSMYMQLSETLSKEFIRPKLASWLANYRVLFRSQKFMGNTLVFGFVQGGFFSFIAVGAAMFSLKFNMNSGAFGLLWASMAVAYVIGATISAKLTPKLGSEALMKMSVSLGAVSGIAILAMASFGELTMYKVLTPLGFMMMFSGITTPGAIAGAVADHPERAGVAAGLSSALGLVVSGLFTVVCGNIYDGDYQPIAAIMCFSSIAALLSFLFAANNRSVKAA